MSKRRSREVAPVAPFDVSSRIARRWARLGRRDARRFGAQLDTIVTHSLLRAEGEIQQGQHKVNAWLIGQVAHEQTSNERILVAMRKAQADRELLLADPTESARAQHYISMRIERIDANLVNMESQWRANVTKGRGWIQTAKEALGTWDKYFFQIAAIYTRARANAARQNVSAAEAKVPSMRSVPLVSLKGFDSDRPPLTVGARK